MAPAYRAGAAGAVAVRSRSPPRGRRASPCRRVARGRAGGGVGARPACGSRSAGRRAGAAARERRGVPRGRRSRGPARAARRDRGTGARAGGGRDASRDGGDGAAAHAQRAGHGRGRVRRRGRDGRAGPRARARGGRVERRCRARGGPHAARGGGRDDASRAVVRPAGGGGDAPGDPARRARASRGRAGAAGRAPRGRARPAGGAGGAAGGGARAAGALAGRGRPGRGPSRGGPCPRRARRHGRGEAEWRKPLEQLLAAAPEVSGDIAWLRQEDDRLRAAIDAVGPVNALAVDEHGEETKRLEFLMTQRDDLVAARQSLQQAAREIDHTAKGMFLESFGKVREHFRTVFQTLFGGGECDVRLANEDEPLESEIEIHAAPRGKRTQRIHLLSSGERTLVAVSLLFAIFLTKPSPFCLLDEVDAPLDDANVGRYVRLLAEFKDLTQFIVITHNPRTMQAADAVYGVTMQEPGVSTIVGVRLGQMEPV